MQASFNGGLNMGYLSRLKVMWTVNRFLSEKIVGQD